ncbi:MAG TPA: putative inorganic carbon transporter subunit DabA, partial [Gemmataceae bacterium]|nr:putative inorganic carbon transporter subunit DabA [Gemmataceae bacterium]
MKSDWPADPPHGPNPLDHLRHAIDHAAHLLPAQGPITVFIHHNTLHAFEHLPFEEAVEQAAGVFGCEPYLTEERYRRDLARGRILLDDLRADLAAELGDRASEPVGPSGTRFDLRLAMLQHPLASGSAEELRWFLAETDGLKKIRPEAAAHRDAIVSNTLRWVMRDLRNGHSRDRERGRGESNSASPAWVREQFAAFDVTQLEAGDDATWEAFTVGALWRVCEDGLSRVPDPTPPPAPPIRHRDLLLRVAGVDPDAWVHDVLIRFSAAFLDQGVSHWTLPDQQSGFFQAFCALYSRGLGPPDRWLRGVAAEAARLAAMPPLEAAVESLTALGVPQAEWDEYLSATMLALRGWGGMVHQVEQRGDRVAYEIPAGSLHGFVAVRLLLDRFAAEYAAREALDYRGPLDRLRPFLLARLPESPRRTTEERAVPLFQVAQLLGWTPEELARLTPDGWRALAAEVEAFPAVRRRRVFHRAYERRFREQCLDALALHPPHPARDPAFQVVTCLDEREESFRRHLEEVAPECETFSAAGFF